jgi:hypothetical protein
VGTNTSLYFFKGLIMKNKPTISLAEPPEGSYLQSEIVTETRTDFYRQVWTLKYRSWTVTVRGEVVHPKDFLAYCFYTPSGEAKLALTVELDKEDKSYKEMFKHFEWVVFANDSKIIEVDMEEDDSKQEKPVPNIKRLTGRRASKAVS